MTDAPIRTWPLTVPVGRIEPFTGDQVLRGWLMGPSTPDPDRPATVVHCFAGGGIAVGAFDLHVDGVPDMSLAEHLAGEGRYVVALDHLGVGGSSAVDDRYLVDPDVVVQAHERAVDAVDAGLARGDLVPGLDPLGPITAIGLGHSMGAMVVDLLQVHARCFAGLVVLGHSASGLPGVLCAAELALVGQPGDVVREQVVALARARFEPGSTVEVRAPEHGVFFGADVPDAVRSAVSAHQADLLPTCGLMAIIPGSIEAEMAAIDVPVFLGIAEHDLVREPHAVVASYRGSAEVGLYVLAGAGHFINEAGNRMELWHRLDAWMDGLEARGGTSHSNC